jgi:hypothetical protein
MLGHIEGRPSSFWLRVHEGREVLPDHRRHGVAIDVADNHDGHQVGAVPVPVEPDELFALCGLDHRRRANRRSIHVPRSLELHASQLLFGPLAGAQPPAPLGEDDWPLAIDPGRFEGGAAGSLRAPSCGVEGARLSDGTAAYRFIEAVPALASRRCRPQRAEEVGETDPGKRRALELHVLDEVRQAELIFIFEHRLAFTTSRSSTCFAGFPLGRT